MTPAWIVGAAVVGGLAGPLTGAAFAGTAVFLVVAALTSGHPGQLARAGIGAAQHDEITRLRSTLGSRGNIRSLPQPGHADGAPAARAAEHPS